VEVSLPEPTHTLPGHLLIQCEAPATRLNGWSWEVEDQFTLRPPADGLHFARRPMVYTSPAGRWFTLRPPADGLYFARRPMVYTSPEIQLLLTKRERWIFYNPGVISDPNPRVGTSIFLVW